MGEQVVRIVDSRSKKKKKKLVEKATWGGRLLGERHMNGLINRGCPLLGTYPGSAPGGKGS